MTFGENRAFYATVELAATSLFLARASQRGETTWDLELPSLVVAQESYPTCRPACLWHSQQKDFPWHSPAPQFPYAVDALCILDCEIPGWVRKSDSLDITAEKRDKQVSNPTLMTSQTPEAPCRISGSISGHVRSSDLAANASIIYHLSGGIRQCVAMYRSSGCGCTSYSRARKTWVCQEGFLDTYMTY